VPCLLTLTTWLGVAGRWAELLATGFSVLAILGAAIVYWVLMSNFLFSTVQYVHDEIVGTNDTDTGIDSIYVHSVVGCSNFLNYKIATRGIVTIFFILDNVSGR
jgi:hypothetical protein